jgi:hypothetical protein
VGFDVPANGATRCAIKFTLPPKVPGGYQWTVNGSGKLDVWSLASIIQNGVLKPALPLLSVLTPDRCDYLEYKAEKNHH